MVKIPYIKIPSVRVGSIGPTSNIGTGGATPAPPTPITYLTQWKIVGNSEVHTDPFLTSWKVSGNSVVDNNTILSCGDLGQDGKYHVKISNGVDIYDIALTEPLRKVNNMADTIEFPSDTEGKALVTRNLNTIHYNSLTATRMDSENKTCNLDQSLPSDSFIYTESVDANIIFLCNKLNSYSLYYGRKEDLCIIPFYKGIFIRNASIEQTVESYQKYLNGLGVIDVIYKLATPTTELVDAPQIAVSPTYTSANETPYSAFEHTENKEIWSCGEYNATDGKYHILVKPEGGSIADIALDEPLRKVNSVADSIEFPSSADGKALVTRHIGDAVNNIGNTIAAGGMDVAIPLTPKGKSSSTNVLSTIANQNGVSGSGSYVYFLIDGQPSALLPIWKVENAGKTILYELATPTTELVDAPQIEEAESYTCEISQGGKAVSWSSFTTE